MRLPTVLLVLHFLDNGHVTLLGEAKVCGIADGFPQDQEFHFNLTTQAFKRQVC